MSDAARVVFCPKLRNGSWTTTFYPVRVPYWCDWSTQCDTMTTVRCTYTVSITTQCIPSLVLVVALLTSATGWQQIVCRWIPPSPSCCGPALNTTSRCWVVVLLPCSSAQILWQPAIMYEYLGWPFRRIWPLRSMFRRPVQLVSTGCGANFIAFGGRLMKNRKQLLCMLSWRHVDDHR